MSVTYEYERPALTVDCVIFAIIDGDLAVLLHKRKHAPYSGKLALPGGYVHIDEGLDDAASRILREKTGVEDLFVEQLYTFGNDTKRDPRGRHVTVAYYALTTPDRISDQTVAATDSTWHKVSDVKALAFDHDEILATALARLQGKLSYEPIGFELLPRHFTIDQLRSLYEAIWGRALDDRNFRRKIFSFKLLVDTGKQVKLKTRPSKLYRFDRRAYDKAKRGGFFFDINL